MYTPSLAPVGSLLPATTEYQPGAGTPRSSWPSVLTWRACARNGSSAARGTTPENAPAVTSTTEQGSDGCSCSSVRCPVVRTGPSVPAGGVRQALSDTVWAPVVPAA